MTDSKAGVVPAPNKVEVMKGYPFVSADDANPFGVKITEFTTVSPDVDASIHFYRDIYGMTVVSDEVISGEMTSAPGMGKQQRRHVLLNMPEAEFARGVRILEAPKGAKPIRPRPESGANDPGLLVLECLTADPAESYHVLKSAGVPTITPPRYYCFRNTMWTPHIDVMSYAAFGPGGEQMFITARIGNNRDPWKSPKLHGGFMSASITSLDQRPVYDFYERAFGLKCIAQLDSFQKNANELIGAPEDSYFTWSLVGSGVNIEVWEFRADSGTVYPCSLDKTGLAMLTVKVNDLGKCRVMCMEAGIQLVGEGALPNLNGRQPEGFTIRGAVGELYEVVQA